MVSSVMLRQIQQRRQVSLATASSTTEGPLQHPFDVEYNNELAKAIVQLRANGKPTNTVKAFQPKMEEYEQFCEQCYPDDNFKYCLDESKLYRFMYYQAFREKKKAGGNKEALASGSRFDVEEYRQIMNSYADAGRIATGGGSAVFPQPTNPISRATFDQYKACMKMIHEDQKSINVCSLPWEMLWKQNCRNLQNHVKERAPLLRRLNYVEKVNGEFSGYTIVEHYNEIEQSLWDDSNTTQGRRNVCSNIRHRACLLMLVSGILRSESLHRAEISDFLSIRPPKRDYDIHPIYVQIQQICEGKTNHGQTLYGRAIRHKDVRLCAIGATAMYLNYQEDCTGEFSRLTIENWLNNEDWFDIKFLVDIHSVDNKKAMRNDTYGRHIKRTLKKLNIMCTKLQHLGRNLGTKLLDLLEEEAGEIKRMGQWNPSIMDTSYSSKLPMGPMRKLAGFHSQNKMYFNTRTNVHPTDALRQKTPLGSFANEMLWSVVDRDPNGNHPTAMHVLRYFWDLSEIFLQDAAALWILHDRRDHPMFNELLVFQCHEWHEYLEVMEHALANESSPLDASLESVLPGVHQWHRANEAAVKSVSRRIDDILELVKVGLKDGFKEITNTTMLNQQVQDKKLAIVFANIAKGLLNGNVNSPEYTGGDTAGTTESGTLSVRVLTQNDGFEPQPNNNRLDEDEDMIASDHKSFRLPSKPQSLRELWEVWFGVGDNYCAHGGVEGRNKKFGAKWRKHIQPAYYSRCCRTIKGIQKYALESHEMHDDAIAKLESLFNECNNSVFNFVEVMQERGYLKKAAKRGKQAIAKTTAMADEEEP